MPAVTRFGDADVTHCTGMTRLDKSSDVFANGIGISRQGDNNTGHLIPSAIPCPGHSAPISSGSSTVYVNGVQAGRVGDPTCTSVAAGSSNVFAGG